ncbi:FAD/NAD(P)-binding domain-containing protein [Zopfia rhizophila CBS 207.26]|uniref:FAD/NAD(P)-binding domain-containing protein n=1 Tax=Zopfia rhizophila CBS 207.26 TaxID=1314779 RepID=A0A6A6EPJ6_9PEZI|nr:FAD/NAD(P)-binding domain-containing protein [Zopfia rhizophila CBS 207.26]
MGQIPEAASIIVGLVMSEFELLPTANSLTRHMHTRSSGCRESRIRAALHCRNSEQQTVLKITTSQTVTNEDGAAVHLAPNANGLLRRHGIFAESTGANLTLKVIVPPVTQYIHGAGIVFSADLEESNKMWQHPWLLAHRVHLLSELKRGATANEGPGTPAILRTSSKAVDVDANGLVTLANGEQIRADLIVGADGVHSRTRAGLPCAEGIKTFGSGKSAFRFPIDRKAALADPATRKFAENRRVVIYPPSYNELLNFVCIHPTAGSETLKVWELLDIESLQTWTDGRLVLIGDAAHPFTPRQDAGQTIEDTVCLAVVLPLGTAVDEIPERLRLYEKYRYEHASRVQEYSRIAGRDLGDGPPLNVNEYIGYNFGHYEWDHSTQELRKWIWKRNPNLGRHDGTSSTFTTASVKFKMSRTLLQNLFPTPAFRFKSPATVAYATFPVTTLAYSHFGLYIHAVQYMKKNGEEIVGTFLPILFEDLSFRTSTKTVPSLEGADEGILCHKYIPKTCHAESKERGQADIAYTTFIPHAEEAKVVARKMTKIRKAAKCDITFDAMGWKALPTFHYIVARLAEILIYEVVEAKVVEGTGVSDVSSARRVK